LKTGELEYDQNPLRYYGNYYLVPTPDRAYILKALIDWVLQEGIIVRQGIEQNHDISRVEPFGFDQARRVYWHFGGIFRLSCSRIACVGVFEENVKSTFGD
jgi:hypothetical protein